MGWNGSKSGVKSGFLAAKMDQNASKPTFQNPFRHFHENPLFTQSKVGGNCFLKTAPEAVPMAVVVSSAFWNSLCTQHINSWSPAGLGKPLTSTLLTSAFVFRSQGFPFGGVRARVVLSVVTNGQALDMVTPNKSIDQIGKMSENFVCSPSRQFSDIFRICFRQFFGHFVDVPFFWAPP